MENQSNQNGENNNKKKKRNIVKNQYSHLTLHFLLLAFLLILQIFIVIAGIWRMFPSAGYMSSLIFIPSFLCSVKVANSNCDSGYKISWIIGITLAPFVFIPMYFLFGTGVIKRKMSNHYQKTWKECAGTLKQSESTVFDMEKFVDSPYKIRMKAFSQMTQTPIYDHTNTKYLANGTEYFDSLCDAIYCAQNFIFMEYFIISHGEVWDRVLKLLRDKAENGVEVRIIYDDLGTVAKLDADYAETLESYGFKACKFNRFRPILSASANYRDHRKLVVIDGKVGFCGGINIGDEYANITHPYGYWKDTGLRLEGDAVEAMTLAFLHMWDFNLNTETDFSHYLNKKRTKAVSKGFVIPYIDHPTIEGSISMSGYINLINAACESIYLTTPYLVPDESVMDALCIAARNGINVNIITPSIPDKKYVFEITRSNYRKLLKYGANIYEYDSGFIHAKSIVVDETAAILGSTNMDYRSLYLNYENGAMMYQTQSVKDIVKDLKECCKNGRKITLNDKDIIKRGNNIFVIIIRLLSPML